ncbi:aminopeptidase N [Micrococcoides hystricis]|uniref:Aminopeptidase N n=1 Tax=Micrococcoides hystricis TaxID=1572761 RepID=A0ABV6P9C0_9MICC
MASFLARENLTREEASVRAGLLSPAGAEPITIAAVIDLRDAKDLQTSTFPVTTTITFACSTPGAETFVDFINAGVDEVVLNGTALDLAEHVGPARIRLPELKAHNTVVITGHARYSSSGEGMHRYQDPADQQIYLYTQYEPADARRVIACFEQPDLKAKFDFTLIGPDDWVLASNMEPVRRSQSTAGSVEVKFGTTALMSSYITTLLAGPYAEFTDSHGSIPLALYCRQSLRDRFDHERLFRWTKLGLDFFEEYFDYPYPWGKYDQAFVPEYNLGAMENPGLVTFNDRLVFEPGATHTEWESLATVLMHEMSHMWFGDLVTMRWWDDLWLKESFADYMGTLAVVEAVPEFASAWVSFAVRRKAWAYEQDQLPTTHPIVADIPDLEAAKQNFDGITYAKGASVLKQLVAYVGPAAFQEASRQYFKKHAWGNTTLRNFLTELSSASGRNMSQWAQDWLTTCGVQSLAIRDGHVEQSGTDPCSGAQSLRPHTLKVGVFDTGTSPYLRVGTHEVTLESAKTAIPGFSSRASVLTLPNDEDLTYAKISFADTELSSVLTGVTEDELANATIWAGLWNMVRDAELPAVSYIKTALELLPQLQPITLFTAVNNNIITALERYVVPCDRGNASSAVAQNLLQMLPALSQEEQMTAAKTIVAAAQCTDLADQWLEELLQTPVGEKLGSVTSTDGLRWSALTAFARQGAATEEELASFRAQRPNTATEVGFAMACAAIPTPEAKEAAWQRIFSGTLSNELLSATITGFQCAEPELLQAYHDQYLSWIGPAWEQHSIGIATRMVAGLFPRTLDSRLGDDHVNPVVLKTQAWLEEHPDAPQALRRIVTEELDQARRTLRVLRVAAPYPGPYSI